MWEGPGHCVCCCCWSGGLGVEENRLRKPWGGSQSVSGIFLHFALCVDPLRLPTLENLAPNGDETQQILELGSHRTRTRSWGDTKKDSPQSLKEKRALLTL